MNKLLFSSIDRLVQEGISKDITKESEEATVKFLSPAIIDEGNLLHGVVMYDRHTSVVGPGHTYVVHSYTIDENLSKASLFRGTYDLTEQEAWNAAKERASWMFPRYVTREAGR